MTKNLIFPEWVGGTMANGLSMQTVLNKINKIIKQIITIKNHFLPWSICSGLPGQFHRITHIAWFLSFPLLKLINQSLTLFDSHQFSYPS